MTPNEQLIEALRKAEGPSRELDGAIGKVLATPSGNYVDAPYTSEETAIIRLVRDRLPDVPFTMGYYRRSDGTLVAFAQFPGSPKEDGPDMAIALCIAFLVELEKRNGM